jgi:ribosomal protein L11 methyltransferase
MSEPAWVEVSLTVDGELAEAVAEVLVRYIPAGVVIESTAVHAGPEDENGQAVGPLRVCGYLPVDEALEGTRRKIEEGLWYLGRITPLPAPIFRSFEEVNWVDAWKQHYHPIPVGAGLMIVPAWLEHETGGRLPIRIDPGMAFGTGTHPTTQLCLALTETFFQQNRDCPRVLDIGCGSGILAVAALKLGAMHALGVDIDPLAMEASRHNAALNGVDDKRLELGVGSVAEVKQGRFSLQQGELVFANILAPVLVRLLNEGLGELVIPGGWLVLSGILAEQSAEVEAALTHHNMKLLEHCQSGDWVALAAQRPRSNSPR